MTARRLIDCALFVLSATLLQDIAKSHQVVYYDILSHMEKFTKTPLAQNGICVFSHHDDHQILAQQRLALIIPPHIGQDTLQSRLRIDQGRGDGGVGLFVFPQQAADVEDADQGAIVFVSAKFNPAAAKDPFGEDKGIGIQT